MKRIAIAAVLAAGVVAVPAVVAADSSGQAPADDGPYAQAHNVRSPLGPLYGPVKAGPPSSTSYGYLTR